MLVKIDSSKRINGSPSKCAIVLNQQLQTGTYLMRSCLIPLSYYNINSSNNNFSILDGSTVRLITVPSGFYTLASLCSALQTGINAMSPFVFNFSLNTNTGKITIRSTGTFVIQANEAFLPSTILQILGFDEDVNTSSVVIIPSVNNSAVAKKIASFNFPLSFNFKINEVSNSVFDVDGVNSSAFVVPILGNAGNLVQLYEPEFRVEMKIHQPLKTLSVSVCDDNGKEVELMSDWYVLLEKSE